MCAYCGAGVQFNQRCRQCVDLFCDLALALYYVEYAMVIFSCWFGVAKFRVENIFN